MRPGREYNLTLCAATIDLNYNARKVTQLHPVVAVVDSSWALDVRPCGAW